MEKYNDEIIMIESLEEGECIDITVSDDNIFYANGILTHNSWAIPATADWMGIIIQTPEMYESGNYLLKCVKTRFSENVNEIYQVGCERPKMRLTDLGEEDHEVPLSVRDSHAYQDRRKELEMESNRDDDAVWVFNEELE